MTFAAAGRFLSITTEAVTMQAFPSRTAALRRRAFLAALSAAPFAHAATPFSWPNRALTIVVPTGAGPGPDATARRMAELAAPALGQPVVVDNRPGAAGALATDRVVHANDGGHSLLLGTSATICINPLLQHATMTDPLPLLQPVCMLTRGYPLLVVGADFPAPDLQQFVARARNGAGQVSYASSGVGSSPHLAGALLANVTGTSLYHVPYSDEARAITDVVGGQVNAIVTFPAAVAPHVQAGRLKAIAVAGPARCPLLPNVRTAAEQGFGAFQMSGWLGLFATAGLAAENAARLEHEFVRAAHAPAYADWIASFGSEAVALPARDFAAAIQSDRAMYAGLLRAAHVTAERS